jgi:hypothetical protein
MDDTGAALVTEQAHLFETRITMTIKPITPKEAKKQKVANIPAEVILAVNQLITEKLGSTGTCIFTQTDIVERILALFKNADSHCSRDMIFDNKWLDFEPLFEAVGWNIKYDDNTFTFTERQRAYSKANVWS